MKKTIILLVASVFAFASCTKEKQDLPTVSFATAQPIMSDGVATLTLQTAGYNGTEPVNVPVTFKSDAEKGVAYEVSAEAFVIGGANPVNTITVTPKDEIEKTIEAVISVPDGFAAGQYTSSVFKLNEQRIYLSFTDNSGSMADRIVVGVEAFDDKGKAKKFEQATTIKININKEKSTAVEGTHFTFPEKSVTIDAGKSKGEFIIDAVEGADIAGHDKLVLDLDLENKYYGGNAIRFTVNINGTTFSKLDGKWVINELVTDKDYMKETWWITDDTEIAKFPEFNANDFMEFDLSNNTFKPHFESSFKNYFIGNSEIAKDRIVILRDMSNKLDVNLFSFNNINRYFSDTQESDNKTALVGIRFSEDEDTQDELLNLYIVDYEPKDFLNYLYEIDVIDPAQSPTTMVVVKGEETLTSGAFIHMTFKKAE